VCPTGALSEKTGKWDGKPGRETVTTCPFCVSNLRVGKEKNLSPVEVKDLVELIEPLVEG
jgi:Fe-S oxidoreductase